MLMLCHLNLNLQIDKINSQLWPHLEQSGQNFGIRRPIPESRLQISLKNWFRIIHRFFQILPKNNHKNPKKSNFQFSIMLVKRIKNKKPLIKQWLWIKLLDGEVLVTYQANGMKNRVYKIGKRDKKMKKEELRDMNKYKDKLKIITKSNKNKLHNKKIFLKL